jgi:hypothetical protein
MCSSPSSSRHATFPAKKKIIIMNIHDRSERCNPSWISQQSWASFFLMRRQHRWRHDGGPRGDGYGSLQTDPTPAPVDRSRWLRDESIDLFLPSFLPPGPKARRGVHTLRNSNSPSSPSHPKMHSFALVPIAFRSDRDRSAPLICRDDESVTGNTARYEFLPSAGLDA